MAQSWKPALNQRGLKKRRQCSNVGSTSSVPSTLLQEISMACPACIFVAHYFAGRTARQSQYHCGTKTDTVCASAQRDRQLEPYSAKSCSEYRVFKPVSRPVHTGKAHRVWSLWSGAAGYRKGFRSLCGSETSAKSQRQAQQGMTPDMRSLLRLRLSWSRSLHGDPESRKRFADLVGICRKRL